MSRIINEHSDDLVSIAHKLTADEVPTARGRARWYPSAVRALLRDQDAAVLAGVVA